jgi:hypothetical protein
MGQSHPDEEARKLFVAMTISEGGLRDEEAMAWTDKHTFFVQNSSE